MSYKLLTKGGHECDLPDPRGFTGGDMIECTEMVFRDERQRPCARKWHRTRSLPAKWAVPDTAW